LSLTSPHRGLDVDDDDDDMPIQRVVPAGTEAPPITRAPISIFAIQQVLRACKQSRKAKADIVRGEPTKVLETAAGVTRIIGRGYPSDRLTAEKKEQELARRARQRPPKPTKKARTKSKKLRDLVGADDDGFDA
jgi:hypothetical protein